MYLIFLIRFIKNIKKFSLNFLQKVKYEYFNYRCRRFIGYSLAKSFVSKKYKVIGIDNFDDYYSVKLKKKTEDIT